MGAFWVNCLQLICDFLNNINQSQDLTRDFSLEANLNYMLTKTENAFLVGVFLFFFIFLLPFFIGVLGIRPFTMVSLYSPTQPQFPY